MMNVSNPIGGETVLEHEALAVNYWQHRVPIRDLHIALERVLLRTDQLDAGRSLRGSNLCGNAVGVELGSLRY